jgi:hypothetical protein
MNRLTNASATHATKIAWRLVDFCLNAIMASQRQTAVKTRIAHLAILLYLKADAFTIWLKIKPIFLYETFLIIRFFVPICPTQRRQRTHSTL